MVKANVDVYTKEPQRVFFEDHAGVPYSFTYYKYRKMPACIKTSGHFDNTDLLVRQILTD